MKYYAGGEILWEFPSPSIRPLGVHDVQYLCTMQWESLAWNELQWCLTGV